MTSKENISDPQLLALADRILADTGFDIRQYKERPLKRRLAVRMRACKAATYAEYVGVLAQDCDVASTHDAPAVPSRQPLPNRAWQSSATFVAPNRQALRTSPSQVAGESNTHAPRSPSGAQNAYDAPV